MAHPVALDTTALIFAIEGIRDPARQALGLKVTHLIERLSKAGTPIAVPAVALSEFLVKYREDEVEPLIEQFRANYLVEDFGPKATIILAQILRDKPAVKAARDSASRTGNQIKLDALIAAIALGAGAREIVTRDRDYETLTGGKLKMKLIDDLPSPPADLFAGK